MDFVPEHIQSEFNMSVNTLQRIHSLLVVINQAKLDSDAYTWITSLATLRTEAHAHIQDVDKRSQLKKKVREMQGEVNEYLILKNPNIPIDLWNGMDDIHEVIMERLKEAGLLMKTADSASKALK